MTKQIFCRFTAKPNQKASAQNIKYITRERALDGQKSLFLHNIDHLRGSDTRETKTNLTAYAETRLIEENHMSRRGAGETRTHYRLVVSFDRKEKTEKAQEMTADFLKENFSKARAVAAVHQDTEHTHVHVWIDARQLDGKKIDLDNKQFKTIDERWAKIYGREYGAEYEHQHTLKKLETREYKRNKAQGEQVEKPIRYEKRQDFNEREYKNYGIEQGAVDGDQRVITGESKDVDRAEQSTIRTEQAFRRAVSSVERLRGSVEGLDRHRERELQQTRPLDQTKEHEQVTELAR
jgi:hypothetical protein